MSTRALVLSLAALAAVALPSTALAAPPDNDKQANATSIDPLPTTIDGDTSGATLSKDELGSRCARISGSVWYKAVGPTSGRVVVTVQAKGDLDLAVDVYKRVRSQLIPLNCDASDSKGSAATDFQAGKGVIYLIRVSERTSSVSGSFTLHVSAPIQPARPPGRALPKTGITSSLLRVEDPDDAYSVVFHEGVSYRIHLTGRRGACDPHLLIYGPGTTKFSEDQEIGYEDCDEYILYTPPPGAGGRYSLRVIADSERRGLQHYHLQVAPAGPDDTAPGSFIHDGQTVHGSLTDGHIDVVDIYRFDVTERSVTFLRLLKGSDDFSLELLNSHGHHLADGDTEIRRRVKPGHYFVVVRTADNGHGRYTLRRTSRAITKTHITLTGGMGGLTATASTSPASGGQYTITFERFDPLAGWIFAKQARISGTGSVSATYVPPGPGLYRARSAFLGTKKAAGSHSGFARLDTNGSLMNR